MTRREAPAGSPSAVRLPTHTSPEDFRTADTELLRASEAGPVPVPHVVAWNLTRRCNLACAHCYISAGSWHAQAGELSTARCLQILDQVLDVNPHPMLILSGGEPLLRDDLETLSRHASRRGATVVVGTNGTRLTADRIGSLKASGVKGVAVSVDSLQARYHDRFRHGEGALAHTLAAVERLQAGELDFVIQTTVTTGNRHELERLSEWAADAGAVSFNVYFIVGTGRGSGMPGLSPEQNEEVLQELVRLELRHRGRMMVRSKCQPQLMRHVVQGDPDSPLLNYETRCPCGVHYCRITPDGKVTPCPYMPVVAGDLSADSFGDVWSRSPVFRDLRSGALRGRCGACEYREVCGGCRARAYADGGDYLGTDESCVHQPRGDGSIVRPSRTMTYGASHETTLPWSPRARARIQRVPSFVRGVVSDRVERFARERGYVRVDLEVMAEVRRSMPVDFSRRLPFFLKKDDQE